MVAAHSFILEARTRAHISGVNEVMSFDDRQIEMATADGVLVISGAELRMGAFDTESGELAVEGRVDSIVYADRQAKKTGMLTRLFK